MKLKAILSMPFALVADVVSLGNIGGNRSFTQQVIDNDRRERDNEQIIELIRALKEQK